MTAFTMDLAEGIGVADAVPVQNITLAFSEAVGIAESGNIQPLVALAESLGIVDTSVVLGVALALAEGLDIKDFAPFNSNMVMSNIKVLDQFLDLFEFAKNARADRVLGFDPFSRLIPGDKDYQNGILKLTVRAPTNFGEDRIGIGQTVLNVDVEDVDDRDDNVSIPAAVTTINYNKEFKIQVVPVVQMVSSGGPRWIDVTNETLTSFDVALRKTTGNNNPFAGVINWTAKGY